MPMNTPFIPFHLAYLLNICEVQINIASQVKRDRVSK